MANSDIKSSSEFHALHGFLAGHASSESHAQEKFCEPVEDKYMQTQDNEAIEELLWTAWQAVIETAKATPHHSEKRQKLVDFVLDIQKRPALAKDGKVCKVWDATVWADLPVFGAQVRENWNSTPNDKSSTEEKQHWLNLNAFVASLVASAHNQGDKPDFTLFAVWSLREALENEQPSKIAIETAAVWAIYAAPALLALCKAEKSFDGKLAQPGSMFQSKEWKGFSVDRWRAWTSRLAELQTPDLGHGEKLVTQARQTMGELMER